MSRQSLQRNHWLTFFIIASVLSPTVLPFSASAQDRKRKPVVVSFGQPNIWSLEQAHYLLARMHMTNLEIQATALDELDPNETHGVRPSLMDVQLLSTVANAGHVEAVLIGSGFDNAKDTVYVNGVKLDPASRTFKSPNLYELKLPVTTDDLLKVTVVQEKTVITKSIPNPNALKIANATILNSATSLLTVKIDGTGFTPRITIENTTGAQTESLEFVSGSELIVRLRNPQPPIVLRVTDPLTGRTVSTVISTLHARK